MSGADRSSHYQSGSESDLVPKTTIFGAPACRLTRQTIALTAALSGFVLAGTGAAVAGLQFQESFALVVLRIISHQDKDLKILYLILV